MKPKETRNPFPDLPDGTEPYKRGPKEVAEAQARWYELLESFVNVFGGYDGFASNYIEDHCGGELYYAYRPAPPKILADVDGYLARRYTSEADQKLVREMLPKAKEAFQARIHAALKDALVELVHEVLDPLYEATGKPWVGLEQRFDPANPERSTAFRLGLVSGRVTRTPIKKKLTVGAPSKVTREGFDRVMRGMRRTDRCLKAVAEKLEVSERSLNTWIKNEGWYGWREASACYEDNEAPKGSAYPPDIVRDVNRYVADPSVDAAMVEGWLGERGFWYRPEHLPQVRRALSGRQKQK